MSPEAVQEPLVVTSEIEPLSHVEGRVRDIQPNRVRPTLELYFSDRDATCLGSHHGDEIVLEFDGARWVGTVGLKPPNPPYLHSALRGPAGRNRVSDVLLSMDLAPGARIRFRVLEPGHLQLDRVLETGQWSPGSRGPTVQAPRSQPPRHRVDVVEMPAPSIGKSFPFDDRESIQRWAERYWGLISNRESSEERTLEREMQQHRDRGFLDKETFVRLARWKSPRKTPDYVSNTDREVEIASRRAFVAETDAESIQALTALRGVALRTATALLHWMRPDQFPILDFRVVAALGLREPVSWESSAFYTQVADRIRRLARSAAVDLRTLDRALWAWNKAEGVL